MAFYKCWSPDNCNEEVEARVLTGNWIVDAEDAASEYAEDRFYDWEQPVNFDIFVVECNKKGEPCGATRKFNFTVDYEPCFHSCEVTLPPKKEN